MKQIEVAENVAKLKLCPYRSLRSWEVHCVGPRCMKWAWTKWEDFSVNEGRKSLDGTMKSVMISKRKGIKGMCVA